jgi:hypothetical protein
MHCGDEKSGKDDRGAVSLDGTAEHRAAGTLWRLSSSIVGMHWTTLLRPGVLIAAGTETLYWLYLVVGPVNGRPAVRERVIPFVLAALVLGLARRAPGLTDTCARKGGPTKNALIDARRRSPVCLWCRRVIAGLESQRWF